MYLKCFKLHFNNKDAAYVVFKLAGYVSWLVFSDSKPHESEICWNIQVVMQCSRD